MIINHNLVNFSWLFIKKKNLCKLKFCLNDKNGYLY